VVTPDIRLEGSIFATPIDGRENVWKSLRAAAAITDGLSFTLESTASDRSYLEWELEALGRQFQGVTVLALDGSGLIDYYLNSVFQKTLSPKNTTSSGAMPWSAVSQWYAARASLYTPGSLGCPVLRPYPR